MMHSQIDLEQSIIGVFLLNENAPLEAAGIKPEFFEFEANQQIFEVIQNLVKQGKEISLGTILDELLKFNPDSKKDYLLLCISKSSLYHFPNALSYLSQNYKKRRFNDILKEFNPDEVEPEDLLDTLARELAGIEENTEPREFVRPEIGVSQWLEEKARELEFERLSLPFRVFQENQISLGPTWLTTIAARPKMGKSTLGIQIGLELARQKKRVGYFSLEMSQSEVYNRAVSFLGNIPPSVVANWGSQKQISEDSRGRYSQEFAKGMDELSSLEFLVYSKKTTIWDLVRMCKKESKKNHLDLIVIDQLSFIRTDEKMRKSGKVQEYDYIVRELKILAQELKTPVLLLVQMNREVERRGDETPRLSDIKDSGGIEETSDMIMMLHKKEKNANLYITSRHESGGKFQLCWDPKLAKFTD